MLVLLIFVSLLPFGFLNAEYHSPITIPVYGNSTEGYYITLNIGTPPQEINVLIDTGSSNLAVSATENANLSTFFHVDQSRSYRSLNETINVEYTEGSWEGTLGTDIIYFDNASKVIVNMANIVASKNFFSSDSQWQGILGLAFNEIAKPDPSFTAIFESLSVNLKLNNSFSMLLCGKDKTPGELVLGGISPRLFSGDLLYTSILKEWYYEVALVDIAVGDIHWPHECSQLNEDKTIVDSGTSDLRLPKHVFSWFVETVWSFASITLPKEISMSNQVFCLRGNTDFMFPSLSLTLRGKETPFTLHLSPELYLRETSDIGASTNAKCYKLAVSPSAKGTVIGVAILESFYVVYDRAQKAIGFANGTCSRNESFSAGWVTSATGFHGETSNCIFTRENDQSNTFLHVTAYILAAVCVICFFPFMVMLIHWIWHHLMCFRVDSESNSLLEEYH